MDLRPKPQLSDKAGEGEEVEGREGQRAIGGAQPIGKPDEVVTMLPPGPWLPREAERGDEHFDQRLERPRRRIVDPKWDGFDFASCDGCQGRPARALGLDPS